MVTGGGVRNNVKERQAKPLNGTEVKEAIEAHMIELADSILRKENILSDQMLNLTDDFSSQITRALSIQSRIKFNISFPKVGWKCTVRLEKLDDDSLSLSGEVELDLERNVRLTIPCGKYGKGITVSSLNDEKIPTNIPDADRERFNLPINLEHLNSDGGVTRTDLRELRSKEPKVAARKIEIGSGVTSDTTTLVPDPQHKDEFLEVKVGNISLGSEIIVEEDILPTISEPGKAPLTEPLSNSPLSNQSKPNFKPIEPRKPGRPVGSYSKK